MFATFWVLACAISWLAYAFSAPSDSDAETVSALVRDPLGLVAKFGPSIAGVVVLAIPGAGARILFWDAARRLPAVLLAAAIGVPGAITLGSLWLAASVQGVDNSSLFAAFSLFGAVYWIAVKILLGGGLGEEIGVRLGEIGRKFECGAEAGFGPGQVAIGHLAIAGEEQRFGLGPAHDLSFRSGARFVP